MIPCRLEIPFSREALKQVESVVEDTIFLGSLGVDPGRFALSNRFLGRQAAACGCDQCDGN